MPQHFQRISSRDVIGRLYRRYEARLGASLIKRVAMYQQSNSKSEEYAWLGANPKMREWIGGRQAKRLREFGYTIKNKKYEATIEVHLDDLNRDKTGTLENQINGLADGAAEHPAQLLSELVVAGASTVCYDGQYFFDTDHSEGDSGQQSNKINIDISELAVAKHGIVTDPSDEEMSKAIMLCIQQMLKFKDDQGQPINGTAKEFLVHVPVSLMGPAASAVTSKTLDSGKENPLLLSGFKIELAVDPLLDVGGWTDEFAVYRADGNGKPFIHQEEYDTQFAAKAEGSEFEFDNDMHQYGVKASRGVGYGLWQHAVHGTLI